MSPDVPATPGPAALARALHRARSVDPFTRYALVACIVASALGGIAISVVVLKYGLVPPAEDDSIVVIHRRLFVTQLGHAFAAVIFAITAVLAGATLVRAGGVATGARPDLQRISQRLDQVEDAVRRMTETLEETLERLERREATRVAR